VSDQGQEERPEERPEPRYADETRWERGIRYGHRGRLYLTLVLGILAAILLIFLIARNTRQVKVDYVVGHSRTALIWLVVISAITGWVLGIVTAYLVRRRTRWRRTG
jgi:uncharacterized integral membrane protein